MHGLGRAFAAIMTVLAVGVLAPGCVHVLEQEPSALRARALQSVGEVPAMAIATVRHEAGQESIEVEYAGHAAMEDGRPLEVDSAFVWFSITKLFTATAIMQLHERGLLDIDAPVRDVLGDEWTMHEPRGRPVTARDLLTHSSGLGNPPVWTLVSRHGEPPATCESVLRDLLDEHGPRLHFRPGGRHKYSNVGYMVLGRMIEVADPRGRDYRTYVEDEILDVLGMEHTSFLWTEDQLEHWAVGHSRKRTLTTSLIVRKAEPELLGPELDDWITTVPFEVDGAPYGGLIGPAGDLAKFLGAHLNYGSWGGRRILSPASVHEMQTPHHDNFGRELHHALGWYTGVIDGERYFNHMGKGGGYRPAARIWPARGYGVVVLTNRTRFDPRPITRTVPPR